MDPRFALRPIEPRDDEAVAHIIRTVMPEFGAVGPGYAIVDSEVDTMYATYTAARSAYFVLEREGRVVGGGGVAPLAGSDGDTCELRKMYLLGEARGFGAGEATLARCLEAARGFGFALCYLETLAAMSAAQKLYERWGFARRDGPLGSTGHYRCNRWYTLVLGP